MYSPSFPITVPLLYFGDECVQGNHSSKKCGHLWTPHVLFDLDGYC